MPGAPDRRAHPHPRRPLFTWRGWLIVWLLPLLIVGGLVAGLVASRPRPSLPAAGLGDPYYPDAGATGWDAEKYTIRVRWDEALTRLEGTTTIEGIATAHLPEIGFDLKHRVHAALVDGAPVASASDGAVNRSVVLPRPLRPGERFTLELSYAGNPDHLPTAGPGDPFLRAAGEILIAGEPESSAVWFPANDHPSDAALVEVFATVPQGLTALSVGRLVSPDADADPTTATWHWAADEPMATFLTFLAVGSFDVDQGVADGRPFVYATSRLLPADAAQAARTRLAGTPAVVRELEQRYGPYPFAQVGGVVTGVETWWGALETQTRPVYNAELGSPLGGAWADTLLAHELAHQWFGNHVRPATWADIVNSEGWATFAAQEVESRRSGASSMDDWLRARWRELPPEFWQPSIADPGVANMFGTTYLRGAMALQALRTLVGDETFFRIARAWAQQPGARSLHDWRTFVDARVERDLGDYWAAWYEGTTAPAQRATLGWPG